MIFYDKAVIDARIFVKDGRVVSKAELQRRLQNARTCYCRYKAKMKSLKAKIKIQEAIIKRQNRVLEKIAEALENKEGGAK